MKYNNVREFYEKTKDVVAPIPEEISDNIVDFLKEAEKLFAIAVFSAKIFGDPKLSIRAGACTLYDIHKIFMGRLQTVIDHQQATIVQLLDELTALQKEKEAHCDITSK